MEGHHREGFGRLILPAGGMEIGVGLLRPPQVEGGGGDVVADGLHLLQIPDGPGDLFRHPVVGGHLGIILEVGVTVAGKDPGQQHDADPTLRRPHLEGGLQ